MMKRAELLSPAGSYESFLCAVHAGADAVYLGGDSFSARAYADNFTQEEICRAIRYAHLYGRKVYLTVNTLVREKELPKLYLFLEPLYQAGLDAVIIQDLGVFHCIGEWFPELDRHVSTQMTVTGAYGAAWCKRMGAVRVVPARELSLVEIREIRKKVDIEIETFVHGAMCYCYSGQCLFSSLLGGRSGNRGRCAQPCRLPYRITGIGGAAREQEKGETYPLSLKDMCALELLPELMEAGIDSFKIEGRMKSPEYVAGVTAIYRKYMDRYYENPERTAVEREDMRRLKSLYIRSGISEGYYRCHNGSKMLTLESPGYSRTDEKLAEELRKKYPGMEQRLSADGRVTLKCGEPARYVVSCGKASALATGECVQEAKNRPLSDEDIKKQLERSGNSFFHFGSIETDREDKVFLTVKQLNELRREACEKLEEAIFEENGTAYPGRRKVSGNDGWAAGALAACEKRRDGHAAVEAGAAVRDKTILPKLHISVLTKEQFSAALEAGIRRIYAPYDLLSFAFLKAAGTDTAVYPSLPHVLRKRDDGFLKDMETLLKKETVSGVIIRNLEELEWLHSLSYAGNIVADTGLYLWNSAARSVLWKQCGLFNQTPELYLPLELNGHETEDILKASDGGTLSQVIYGRIPMMVSAGCAAKTAGACRREGGAEDGGFCYLTDRYRKSFPVYLNCRHCYNVIYNTVPLSLHQHMDRLKSCGLSSVRLDFTVEDRDETGRIISFFQDIMAQDGTAPKEPPFAQYTNGHFKRGAK